MQNYLEAVISQYGNSPRLLLLIQGFHDAVGIDADFDAFYNNIWNIDTAQGAGLDVLGRIVGVSRVITIPAGTTNFGFYDGVGDYLPFGQAPFYAGATTQNYPLSDAAFRTLILIKAAANIAATNSQTLNQLLSSLFAGRGRAYVNDLGHMQMRFTFEFYLQPYELVILTAGGVIPRSTGVQATLIQCPQFSTFGFNGSGAETFGNGTFIKGLSHVA